MSVGTRRSCGTEDEASRTDAACGGAATTTMERNGFLAGAAPPSALEVAETLYKIPTLLTTWTRCGKPRCRCRNGRPHGPYHALHWRDGARQRRVYVRAGDAPAVRGAIERRRRERALDRLAFVSDLALLRRIEALRRGLDAELAEIRGRR